MLIDKKSDAVNLMNEYGKNKIPFLFIIDFDMNEPHIIKYDEIGLYEILFDINGIKNYSSLDVSKSTAKFEKYPVSFDTYKKSYDKVVEEITAGNTYLLNLTFPTEIKTELSLKEIFYLSDAKYKLLFKNNFVVFSPETFVIIKDDSIFSFPMKGTIDASIPDAEKIILNDKKEKAEHNTIVDLIRNDLNMVAKNVKVEKYRYIEKLITNDKPLLQVSSIITGQLEKGFEEKLGEIIFTLLPAGSISGAPKKKTVEIINAVENYKRGYYTGIFGFYDGKYLESAVMIRFIENAKDGLIYKSGGGITFMSNAEYEYQELIDKVYMPIV
jgi:para-aminobenzoate synthetase component 1